MIDDQILEDLLREASAAISVPAAGPEHVLAARDRLTDSRQVRTRSLTKIPRGVGAAMRGRPLVTGAVALVMMTAVVGAIGLTSGGNGPSISPGSASVSAPATAGPVRHGIAPTGLPGTPSSVSGSPPSGGTASGQTSSGGPASGSASSTGTNEVPAAPADVIKTGSVSLQVPAGNLTAVTNELTGFAAGLGGFVASTNSSIPGEVQPASGSVTLRVPSASFEALLNDVRSVRGTTVTSVSTSGQDVTSQYVDLSARLQSLEDTRTQFEQILAKAQSIGDILAVEQQISQLQTQIEELQGQQRQMNDQITYGTLAVTITEQASRGAGTPHPPPSGIDRAWDHARSTFARGLESVVGALGGIAVFLVVVGGLAGLARLGWQLARRRLV